MVACAGRSLEGQRGSWLLTKMYQRIYVVATNAAMVSACAPCLPTTHAIVVLWETNFEKCSIVWNVPLKIIRIIIYFFKGIVTYPRYSTHLSKCENDGFLVIIFHKFWAFVECLYKKIIKIF